MAPHDRTQTGSFALALRESQRSLMDELDTSHPFYWAAFALVGDGERALVQKTQQVAAAK